MSYFIKYIFIGQIERECAWSECTIKLNHIPPLYIHEHIIDHCSIGTRYTYLFRYPITVLLVVRVTQAYTTSLHV